MGRLSALRVRRAMESRRRHAEALDRRELLEAQNRDLEAFASRLAHDLKTPIVSLRGFVDLLARRHAEQLDERGRTYLEKIRSSATILNDMVDGLRDLVDASRQLETCNSVDPLPVLSMVADALRAEAAERGVELLLPATAPRVKCDEAKLFQLFQNLLTNAIRHCDVGKPARWVDVTLADADAEVEVRFADNGVGLEPEEMAEIFQPFRRGRGAAGKPGMGLGLAISRRVAQVCGGRIEVQSRFGEGSVFSLFLPRAD